LAAAQLQPHLTPRSKLEKKHQEPRKEYLAERVERVRAVPRILHRLEEAAQRAKVVTDRRKKRSHHALVLCLRSGVDLWQSDWYSSFVSSHFVFSERSKNTKLSA
jgi:GAF domain-containing protein